MLGNLDTVDTAYIECHGTGTPTGDPVEVRAISMAMNTIPPSRDPILIGSVRSYTENNDACQ